MEPTEILIKVKLTPKVLEGLDDDTEYVCYDSMKRKHIFLGKHIRISSAGLYGIEIPLTVTTEMVEKEAEKYADLQTYGYNDGEFAIKDFKAGVNWLLSLNKE